MSCSWEQVQQQLSDVAANMEAQARVQPEGNSPADDSSPGEDRPATSAAVADGEAEAAEANEEANLRTQNSVAPSMPGIAEHEAVVKTEDEQEAVMAGSKSKQVSPEAFSKC